ncbi:hypothetical protein NQ315_002917 [Exocentrus adspersus]|uniref:Uncharacterized protein n=1 Tax=Exocentrus adspersus TaxID=1586481 RepID=A0AAV8V6K9_9CUCU|nr:hypothetical protein NQ315_002917 [Exocentrus adspersus]
MSQQGDHVEASSVVGEEGLDPQALTGSIGAPQGVRQPAVPPGPTGQGLTVEDLIQATVRAMMVYDEQRRRSVPSPSSPSLSGERGADNLMVNKATNKELSNLLPEFTGAGQNINVWLERIDSVQKTYQVPDDVMKLIAIGKLNKGPLEWYHSKVEFVEMDFSTLKATMRKMYAVSSDPITLRKAMERRRWKRGEKVSVYFHEKVLLGDVEFAINNTVSRSTGETPAKLLFGQNQRGHVADNIRLILEQLEGEETKEIESIRDKASQKIEIAQAGNKVYYDKSRKKPTVYKEGDYVMVANVDTTSGVNKKLIPKFRGPYVIKTVLPNDRYVVNDITGFQNTQIPYDGVLDVTRLKPYTVSDVHQID